MAAPKVTISNVWHFPLLLVKKNTGGEILKKTAVVRVKASSAVTSRTPIHLVVAIDIGSNVAWEAAPPANKPSRLHLLRKAVKFIIRELHDSDRLTIVFNHNLATETFQISDKDRTSAESKVDQVLAKVDTVFKPALEDALKILDGSADKKYLGFIILLSDGLENSMFKRRLPSTSSVRNLLGKYPIHTFGLSKGHNPDALHLIAKESYGTYSSITENLGSKITEALAVCLGGLNSVVAVDTVIKIKANKTEKFEATIKEIEWAGYKKTKNGTSREITIGILYAGEVKDLIINFELNVNSLEQGHHDLVPLTASGEYKVTPGGDKITIGDRATAFSVYARKITPREERPLLPFPIVQQHEVRTEVLALLAKFPETFQDLEKEAEGDDVKNIAGNKLRCMWAHFKKNNESWKEAEKNGLDLERIEGDIDAMVSCLKLGLGVGCVYSWVLSYQMQRATTTGLPTTAFLMPEMKVKLQKAQKQPAEDAAASSRMGVKHLAPEVEVFLGKRVIDVLEQIAKGTNRPV